MISLKKISGFLFIDSNQSPLNQQIPNQSQQKITFIRGDLLKEVYQVLLSEGPKLIEISLIDEIK